MNSLWNKMMKDHFSYYPKVTLTASIKEAKRPKEGATRTTLVEQKQVCVYPNPDDGKYTWEDTDGSS